MARRMSRFIHFAMAAGKEAVDDSGLDFAAMSRSSATASGWSSTPAAAASSRSSTAPTSTTRRARASSARSPSRRCRARWRAAMLSMEYGLTGPVITQVAACATSVIAFQDALRLIRSGECDVVSTGGSEAPILPIGVAALGNMGALSKRNDDPETASRPFDRTRDGFVFGEGARRRRRRVAEHALERGATPIAEVIGAALTADAFHISAPEPTGRGAARAMTKALRNAGVAPDEVDYIVAHGTSTPLNDVTETRAIKAAFGEHAYKVAISSPKSMVGHLLGAAGIASALAGDRRDPRRRHPADDQPRTPTPNATSTTSRSTRARPGSTRRRSTASGSAARTPSRSSGSFID